jgi:RHS repeat-associated protein
VVRTSVTDQNQHSTTYAYDDADRLTSVTDAATNQTQYAYDRGSPATRAVRVAGVVDTESNLTGITDAKNRLTSFAYDIKGRLTQTTFPSTLSESYTYDAIDNLTSKTDRKSQTISYVYDALNRLTHKGYPDSTGVDFIYDLVGKIKQVTDPTGTYGFAYDNMGRMIGTTTQYTFIPNQTYSNTYTYDAASNRTGLQAPDGSTTSYVYDVLNRLTDQTNSWAGHFVFSYDDLSRRTLLTRPNGVNTSYSYDNLSRLMSVVHQQGTTNVDGATYTYDNAGNRLSKQNLLNNVTEHYDYDGIYQLKHVIQDLSGGGQTTTESYTYDQVGNRLSALNVSQYNYDSSNHLNSSSDGVTYTYDNNGNTLTKTDANGTTQYAWDFDNHLKSVTLLGSGGVVGFKYDPFGRRIQKSSAAGTTNYVYDGANIVAELSLPGVPIAKYAQSRGIDEVLAMSRGGVTDFYNVDGLGSVTSLYDSAGISAGTYGFTSFGNATSTGGLVNPFQYSGRESDSETGIYYYRARYYDSAVGRFISEDPIGFEGGVNFYAFTYNNPTNLVDPGGLKVYPANFIGPLQPGDVKGFIADLSDPALAPLANYPYPSASQFYGESDQCVSFTKHFAKVPCTDCWRAGPPVLGNDIPRGTAIATFDEAGHYPQDPSGHPNSGLYLQPGKDPNSFAILDQWPGHFGKGRTLLPRPGARADNSGAYSVITVPYGTKSKKCKCGNW